MGTLLRQIDRVLLFSLIIISVIIFFSGIISSQPIYKSQKGKSELINIVKLKDLPKTLVTKRGSIPYNYGISPQLLQKLKQTEITPLSGTAEKDLDQMPPLKSTNSEKQGFKLQSNSFGSLDVSFQGLNNSLTDLRPPDPNLAVGSNYIVEAVNSTIAIYTETGTLVKQSSFAYIFSNQNDLLGDPKIVFDQYSQRWVLLVLNFNQSNSQYLIAASETSDPTGQWNIYKQNASLDGTTNTGFYADYPGLALDANAVYITSNQFATGDVFQYSKIRILLKSQLYSGQTLTYTDFTKLIDADSYTFSFTLKPAYNFDNTNSAYFLCDEEFGSNTLTFWKINNPTSSNPQLTMTRIYISPYQQPPSAAQEGNSQNIDVGDCRLQDVICRNGFLYTSFATAYNWGNGNVSAIRYEKINVNTGSVAIDAIYGSDLSFYYYPNVYVDNFGNIGLVFSRSSANEYPGVRWTYRTPDDGTARASQSLQDGLNYYYNPGSDNRNRWGDYSGICLDPNKSNKLWFCGECATSSSSIWGTAIGSFTFITPITFTNELQSNGSNLGGSFLVNSTIISSGQTVNYLPGTNISLVDLNERFTNNKQNNWDNNSLNYLLSQNFSAGNAYPQPSRNEIANYAPLNPATITTNFPEFSSATGLKLQFNDPWYLNSNGTQGNNFAQSTAPLTQNSSPMTGAYNQGTGGVFLFQGINQQGQWVQPYYSISSSQSINLGGSNHPLYAWYCAGSGAVFNNLNAYTIPVEFTSPSSNITAYLKGSLISNNSSTFLNNSQRKFVKTSDGVLHLVYESMGHVWYEISTNGGNSWSIMNNGKPLDNGAGKCPSIDYYGSGIAIVFQQQNGSNYTIQLQTFVGNGSNYVFGASATVYTETIDTYSTNVNPNISIGYNSVFIVTWEKTSYSTFNGSLGIGYKYGSVGFYNNPSITFNGGGSISGTDKNSVNVSIYSNKSDYNDGFQIAYEQDNYLKYIYYCRINISLTWNVTTTAVSNISSGDSYFINYHPSIIGMPNGTAKACWIGDYSGNGSMVNIISRDLSLSNSFYSNGSNVRSTSINVSDDNSCYLSWSNYNGGTSFTNSFSNISTPFIVRNTNTTGQDIQINNGASISTMFLSSFSPFTVPYFFQTSNNLGSFPKANPNSISSGKGIVVVKDGAQFSYSLGDITVDNNKIGFNNSKDTTENSSAANNNIFLTDPITLNNNSDFSFSIMTGLIDSSAALSVLGNTGSVDYKIELIDDASGNIVGTLLRTKISSASLSEDNVSTFKVNTDGLGDKTVRLRLSVNTNLDQPKFYFITRYAANGNVVGKSSGEVNEISVQSNGMVKNYALDQNYPNPFNPTTIINYQIPNDGLVTLQVFDELGREVKTLVNEYKSQGRYSVSFDASQLASGVYFYQLRSGNYSSIKKMVLLK